MSRPRPIQNPKCKPLKPLMGQAATREVQRQKDILRSAGLDLIEKKMKAKEELARTLNPKTGRARYTRFEIQTNYPSGPKVDILQCVQMIDSLPWWRRLAAYLWGDRGKIGGIEYLLVGQTNVLYRAQEWIDGRKGKSFLKIVDTPKIISDGTANEVD
ncbi:MAG: hypothetical protein E3J60_04690 [Dehalococcoidia bacterium]|nr:MAG: hypothetical protein E3J60_04690 [Dehalococcoidia bacterium]